MKLLNLLTFCFVIGLFTITKAQECVVLTSPGFPQIPEQTFGDPQILGDFSPTEIRTVYVAAHIVRSSSGQGGISINDLNTAISDLNAAYSDAMIQFIHNQTDYIDNDNYTTLTQQNFPSLAQINVVSNKLNIYFCPQGSGINGIAYRPGNKCAVTNAAAINGSTLPHEVGHNFYLYHTHSDAADPPNDCTPLTPLELVNGSNCTSAGDFLCDTPAEPFNCGSGILGYVYNNTCNYFGTFRDANNQLYNPDTHNFMGYAPSNCRNSFSALQIQKMNQTLSTTLSYLINVQVPLANKINGNIIPHESNKPSTLTVIGGQTVQSGNNAYLLDGNSYDIRTNQERFTNYLSYGNIKHNNWNDLHSEFLLTENYVVNRLESPHRDANFLGLNYAKIEVKLEGQLITGKGAGEFQDPWFVLANGSQPGNYWKPFTSFYEPTGKEGATEKGVFLNQGYNPVTQTWQPPYYSVKTDAVQDVILTNTGSPTGRNHKFYFQNWGGTNVNYQNANALETPVVFTLDGATAQANLKGTQLTNNSNAYSTGQRKVIKIDSRLYNAYDSMGKVFLESSSDNGQTWRIENNGMPLNSGSGARCPDITTAFNGSGNCVVTFQELIPNSTSSKVKVVSYYWYSQQLNIIGEFVIENSSSISLNPITTIGFDHTVVTTYEKNGTLESRFGFWYLGTYPHITISWSSYSIELFVNNYSEFSQVTGMDGSLTKYHLVARKNVAYNRSDIVYKKFKVQRGTTGGFDPNDPNDAWLVNEIIESNVTNKSGGSEMNIRPSISLANNYPIVSWITGYYSGSNDLASSRLLTRRGPIWGATNSNGYQVKSVNNNSTTSTTEKSVIVYTENNSSFITKWIKRTGTSFTIPQTLSHSGNQTQVTSGSDYQFMNAMVFNSSALPYYFIKSSTDFSSDLEENNGGLNKITQNDTIVTFGRSGIASVNDIEFVFEIGDILVGDSIIKFIEIPDTISYLSSAELNEHTRTSSFTLTPSTNFYFSNIYFVVTKSNPDTALTNTDAVNFKAELVNSTTNQVVGTFDNITYNKNNLEKYASIDYQVDCSGITPGEYYLRLVTNVNTDASFALANIISDNTTLAKKDFNLVNFTGSEIPITYNLEQNFPNPFNPSTTIRYQIPQDGIVTLKIYDILGAEVKTLVNEEKIAGKYEVNFNASSLASGVYIYKIQAGDFVSSKKMILLK